MAENKIICTENNIDYITIRKAMCKDARTVEELKTLAGVCGHCQGCLDNLQGILDSVCGCYNISLQSVVDAVKQGANTVEKVGAKTNAGTLCGRCTILIENVIEIGK